MMFALSQVRRCSRRVAVFLGILNLLDRRGRQRVKADFRAILSGTCGLVQARGLDVTRRSIGVRAAHPIPKGALVFAELVEFGTGGYAYVRRCDPNPDGTYAIGLQFRKELKANRFDIGPWEHHHRTHGPCGAWDSAEA
jgi:hypothetical protein